MILIVTAVHNRKLITEEFINQLKRQTINDWHLILVDDGSTDGTSSMVSRMTTQVTILKGNGNLWWGGAMEKARKWIIKNYKDDDIVLFSNDDVQFDRLYLKNAQDQLKQLTGKILVTGCGRDKKNEKQLDGAIEYSYNSVDFKLCDSEEGNCASTRSLFLRVQDLKQIGSFHPILLPHYFSDYEWTLRACTKKGYMVICDKKIYYYLNDNNTTSVDYSSLAKKNVLTKKNPSNPIYKFFFIILVTPIRFLPGAILSQISRYRNKHEIISDILRR